MEVLLIIVTAILAIGWYGIRHWCKNCSKWNGLKKVGSKFDHTEVRYRTKILKDSSKDGSGRTYRTREREVREPYNVDFYKVHFICRYCNTERYRVMRSGKYMKEATIFFGVCAALIYYSYKTPETKTTNDNTIEKTSNQNIVSDSIKTKEVNTKHNIKPIVHKNNVSSPSKEKSKSEIIDTTKILMSDTSNIKGQQEIKDTGLLKKEIKQ